MRAFRKAGHEVELMCRLGGPLAERARQEGFTVHECRNVPAQLRFLAGAGRYDIIHAQTANTVTWAVLTKWLHRRPVAFAPHLLRGQAERGVEDRLRGATSICSWPSARWPRASRRLGIEPAIIRSAVEPHAINADNVAALVSEFQLDGRKVMATSAALIQDKDPVTLVRAVAELARTRRDFIFLHFGAGGARQAARTRPASWASRTSTASPAFARAWKTSTACWTCSS